MIAVVGHNHFYLINITSDTVYKKDPIVATAYTIDFESNLFLCSNNTIRQYTVALG